MRINQIQVSRFSKLVNMAVLPFGLALLYLMHLVLAKQYSVDDYGAFSLVVSAASFLALLASVGLPGSAQKFVSSYIASEEPAELSRYLSFSFLWLLAVLMLLGLSSVVIISLQPANTDTLVSTLILSGASVIWLWQRYICLGYGQIKSALIPRDVIVPLVALLVLAYVAPDDVHIFIRLYSGIIVLCCLPVFLKSIGLSAARFHSGIGGIDAIVKWLSTARSFLITNTVQLGLNGWDIIILGLFTSLADTGKYAAATRMSMIVLVVIRVLNTIYGHRFSANFATQRVSENERLFKSLRLYGTIIAAVLWLLLLIAVGPLTQFLGEGYVGIEWMVLIIAFANLLIVGCGPVSNYMNMTGLEKIVSKYMVGWSAISVVLNLALIPIFGVVAALIVYCISNVGMRIHLVLTKNRFAAKT